MARRSTDEKVLHVGTSHVPVLSLSGILSADPDVAYSPRSIQYSPIGSSGLLSLYYHGDTGAVETAIGAAGGPVPLYSVNFSPADSEQFVFPQQFEAPKGSGLALYATADVGYELYYVAHDMAAGITKEAARLASLLPVQNPGANSNVTRAPYGRNF